VSTPDSPTPPPDAPAAASSDASGPFRVVAFNGSLRAASSNRGLVHLAIRLMEQQAPGATEIELVDWIDQLPYYNEELEADLPPVVARWRELITSADALLLGMPEYNFGPPAVAKNAIDWLTRPFGKAALTGKVIALLTSGGKGGGTNVQQALTPILGYLGNTMVIDPPVTIALGFQRISPDGATEDMEIIDAVGGKVAAVLAALRAR
jgi:chromate reductase, NAD(P)H dehydrogenase (quinone)